MPDTVFFQFAAGSDWTGYAVETLLRRYGIQCRSRQLTDKTGEQPYGLHVSAAQARWADHVMRRAGVPLLTEPLADANATARERHAGALPSPWTERGVGAGDLSGHLFDFLAGFGGRPIFVDEMVPAPAERRQSRQAERAERRQARRVARRSR